MTTSNTQALSLLGQLRRAVTACDTASLMNIIPVLKAACGTGNKFCNSLGEVFGENSLLLAANAVLEQEGEKGYPVALELWLGSTFMRSWDSLIKLAKNYPKFFKLVENHPEVEMCEDYKRIILSIKNNTVDDSNNVSENPIRAIFKQPVNEQQYETLSMLLNVSSNYSCIDIDINDFMRWAEKYNTFNQCLINPVISLFGSLDTPTESLLESLFYKLSNVKRDNISRGHVIARVLSRVYFTQPVFDYLLKELNFSDRVDFCHHYFIEDWGISNTGVKFTHKHVPILVEVLKRTSKDLEIHIFDPIHWEIGALSEMYYITSNKAHFVLYAAYMKNHTITAEVYRSFKDNKTVSFEDLYTIFKSPCVADTFLSLPHIGRFVQHLSSLPRGEPMFNIKLDPYHLLVPELVGYFNE
jgi:hypothetical protein